MFTDPRWSSFELTERARARLQAYNTLLQDWGGRINLVARSTLPEAEERHFLDSAQLMPLLPAGCKQMLDFGSGAGFPALVIAILAAEKPELQDMKITLLESTGKKCHFLQTVVDDLGLDQVTIENRRVEASSKLKADVITARALANLDKLLTLSFPYLKPETICLFLKGERATSELTDAAAQWTMEAIPHKSMTHELAQILEIRKIKRV